MVNLNTKELFEIGSYIGERLNKDGVKTESTLIVNVDQESFKKIDEDVFYTFKKQGIIGEDDSFIPSENEIKLSFPNLNILIKNS